MLRLPTGMRDRLAAAARETGRSMNAEIVSRLEKSLDQFKTLEELVETVGTVNGFLDDGRSLAGEGRPTRGHPERFGREGRTRASRRLRVPEHANRPQHHLRAGGRLRYVPPGSAVRP
ncbi:Arc family DNA-binding protein [Ancylobacter dichloromethanicus]